MEALLWCAKGLANLVEELCYHSSIGSKETIMSKLLVYLFSKTSFGKMLDGKKTIIGAVFVLLAASLNALEGLAPLFPEHAWIGEAAKSLKDVTQQLAALLDSLGLGLLAVGVLHKGAKAQVK